MKVLQRHIQGNVRHRSTSSEKSDAVNRPNLRLHGVREGAEVKSNGIDRVFNTAEEKTTPNF